MPPESSLSAFFLKKGATVGPLDGQQVVLAFPGDELRVPTHDGGTTLLIPWSHRGRIRASGNDRIKFLQGQCTQDLSHRPRFFGGHSFMLEAKGRVIADPRILITDEAVLLEVPGSTTDELLARLQRFVIAADVQIEDVRDEYEQVLIVGNGVNALAAASQVALPESEDHGVVVDGGEIWVRDGSTRFPGVRIWLPKDIALRRVLALSSLSAAPLDFAGLKHWHHLRVDRGCPWFGREIDGTTLPVEVGLMETTVSLTKGCYCGQEVVARQHYLGKPRRRLVILESGDRVDLQVGMEVLGADGKLLGRITSARPHSTAHSSRAMAVLKGSEHSVGQEYTARQGESDGLVRVVAVDIP